MKSWALLSFFGKMRVRKMERSEPAISTETRLQGLEKDKIFWVQIPVSSSYFYVPCLTALYLKYAGIT